MDAIAALTPADVGDYWGPTMGRLRRAGLRFGMFAALPAWLQARMGGHCRHCYYAHEGTAPAGCEAHQQRRAALRLKKTGGGQRRLPSPPPQPRADRADRPPAPRPPQPGPQLPRGRGQGGPQQELPPRGRGQGGGWRPRDDRGDDRGPPPKDRRGGGGPPPRR